MKLGILDKLPCSGLNVWLPLQHPESKFSKESSFFSEKKWGQSFKLKSGDEPLGTILHLNGSAH